MRNIAKTVLLAVLCSHCTNGSDESSGASSDLKSGRNYPGALWTGSDLIVFGGSVGQSDSFQCLKNTEIYSPSTGRWNDGSPSEFEACYPVVHWTGDQMITLSPKLAAYHPKTNTWNIFRTESGEDFPQRIAVWTGTKIFVCCGGTEADGGFLIDPHTGDSEATPGFDFPREDSNSGIMSTAAFNDKVVIWYRVNTLSSLYSYDQFIAILDLKTKQWTKHKHDGAPHMSDKYLPKYEMFPVGNRLFVNNYLYDPETNLWQSSEPPSGMTGSFYKVFTGSEILFWKAGYAPYQDIHPRLYGFRYNVESGNWSNLPVENAPEPAISQVTLWTGSQMLVLGGQILSEADSNNFIKKISAYNPTTDAWEIF